MHQVAFIYMSEFNSEENYLKYTQNQNSFDKYNVYQEKFRKNIRDSDKKLINLIKKNYSNLDDAKLLDIGCSTGNLLYHLKSEFPNTILNGCDLNKSSIDTCINDKDLTNIKFFQQDLIDFEYESAFEIIIANAVFMFMNWDQYTKSLKNIYKALKPKGIFVNFEWIHPFDVQDLQVFEKSIGEPDGRIMWLRPSKLVREKFILSGFDNLEIIPFQVSTDLPLKGYQEDVFSYTRQELDGEKMSFRGCLYQPWAHTVARK